MVGEVFTEHAPVSSLTFAANRWPPKTPKLTCSGKEKSPSIRWKLFMNCKDVIKETTYKLGETIFGTSYHDEFILVVLMFSPHACLCLWPFLQAFFDCLLRIAGWPLEKVSNNSEKYCPVVIMFSCHHAGVLNAFSQKPLPLPCANCKFASL